MRGKSRQDYQTPPELLRAIERDFGVREWAFDLAATHKNSVSLRFRYGPGSPWGRDSLKKDWSIIEGDCWLNPPFANIAPWAEKCHLSLPRQGRIFMLALASVGSLWYDNHVHGVAHVVAPHPRVPFVGCEDPYTKDLVLAVFGPVRGGFSTWRWRS